MLALLAISGVAAPAFAEERRAESGSDRELNV
jgi:hypothetical protein